MNSLNLAELNSPARQYSAAMDSVNLITALLAKQDKTEEDIDCITRNVEHLKLVVAKDIWTNEDLAPIHESISQAKTSDI
jgi:hypothetical protein